MNPKTWAVTEYLTDYMTRPRMGQYKAPSVWPSEASSVHQNEYDETVVAGKCRRASFLRLASDLVFFDRDAYTYLINVVEQAASIKKPVDKYMRWIWAAGELYETHLIELAKKSGVFIAEQTPIYVPDIGVSGKMDLIVINPFNSMKTVVEIKSVYGHGAKMVMGSPATSRRPAILGTPRDSNLMQIALYDWFWAKERPDFDHSRLVYGARDTGKYAEFEVKTEDQGDIVKIFYRGITPVVSPWIESHITITSILEDGYAYVQEHIEAGVIPERDFELRYSEERILELFDRKELSKADTSKVVRRAEIVEENKQRVIDKKKPKRQLIPVIKGDWNCRFCSFSDFCYNESGKPNEVSI